MDSIDKRILCAARDILAAQGYEAFNIPLVAEKACVDHIFQIQPLAKKNILFYKMVSEFYQGAAEAVSPAFLPEQGVEEMLHCYITAYLRYIDQHREDARAVFEILQHYCDYEGSAVFEAEPVTLYTPLIARLEGCIHLLFSPPLMAQVIQCVLDTIAAEIMCNRLSDVEGAIDEAAVLFDFICPKS